MIFLNFDLLELDIRYNISNFIVTMFLSVSYDCVYEYCSSYSSFVINLHDLYFSNKIYGVQDVCFSKQPFLHSV